MSCGRFATAGARIHCITGAAPPDSRSIFSWGDRVAIEVKAKPFVSDQDLRGLKPLKEEVRLRHAVVACMEQSPRRVDGIEILPWQMFLDRLWSGDFT
jgi:hypothetical protein